MRQAAVVEYSRPCGHRRPRGTADTQPQPCLTRVEHGNPDRVRCAQVAFRSADRKEGPIPWRVTDAQEANAGRSKGHRKTSTVGPLLQAGVVDNWPDTRSRSRLQERAVVAWLRKQADVWQVSL
jgi:hypothetical protein